MSRYTMIIQKYRDQLDAWEQLKDKAPFSVIYIEIRCKHCNSKDISKYGRYNNVQLWWCKQCKRKFTDNHAYPGMKIPLDRVQSAMSMYHKGISLKSICRQLDEEYGYYPSDSTVYRWISHLTKKILNDTKDHRPKVGNTWIAFENPAIISTKKYWILDLIDSSTHFLLASRLSTNRGVDDIRILLESAIAKAGKIPEEIINRRRAKYLNGVEQALGTDSGRVQVNTSGNRDGMKFPVWRSIIKGRSTIMRRLKSLEIARLTLDGWTVYYNYYITQESLKGKTPSQAAMIEYIYESNRWVERI
jgi:transposase-like protein